MLDHEVFFELVWQFYSNINISQEGLHSCVQGQVVSLSEAFINKTLGTSEDGRYLSDVKSLSLKMKDLNVDEWLLH